LGANNASASAFVQDYTTTNKL
jgi:hypothetical protein